jgi:hypothetical protein
MGTGPAPFSCTCSKIDRFYCDFDMLAGQTTSPVVVRHNQLVKPLPLGWMSNNNDVALEVVNQDEHPIFQMYYDGPDKIVINGIIVMSGWVFFVGGRPREGSLQYQ